MLFNLKAKIWFTVAAIVLMYSFFTLYYFPDQQAKLLLQNYNNEVQNLANTVSLGVRIAITEQNFEGVQTAMEFVKDDSRLVFISMMQIDTLWNNTHTQYEIKENLFKTYPEHKVGSLTAVSNDSIIVKRAPFSTSAMSGAILMGFSIKAINEGKNRIKVTSLLVSSLIFGIGILLGSWLSKTISRPVLALRNAAIRVGGGDFTPRVEINSTDEIGDLEKSFNKMVNYLAVTTNKLEKTNESLVNTNQTLNDTLLELKSTQAQLIHSEKMASLGELTAGIAHEIQNPLNFVNNFSEVNIELLEELHQEAANGNLAEIKLLINDLLENELKITHHGKRADRIVKGMLLHSRNNSGQKVLTNINALVDEYLRLSYHGLRTKNKSFHADLITGFDQSLPQVNIVPQDLGRVLLNLFDNAFYAVTEKKQKLNGSYAPQLAVTTRLHNNKLEILVRDNGNGIPEEIKNKIFQPFFTTKPTGEGTGLGLSLSYDIITKGNEGTLQVNSKEGEFTEFVVILPANQTLPKDMLASN